MPLDPDEPDTREQAKNEGRNYGKCRICKKEGCWMAYYYGNGPDAMNR